MYIQKLKLQRFRGAQDLTFELDPKLNVFVGMNGSGKSSVLDAAAILLSWRVNRLKHVGASGRPITESDIKNGESSANLEIAVHDTYGDTVWNLVKVRKGYSKKNLASDLTQTSEVAKKIQSEITEHDGAVNLPMIAYYPVNRAVLDIPLRIRGKHSFDLLSGFDDSLTRGANFRTFFEWFREREDLENEARRDHQSLFVNKNSAKYPDPQLQAVRTALSLFMPEFKNLTVRRNPLRMVVEKKGEELSVNQLSDGEKSLMAIVGDMARRMAIVNPLRANPLEGEGVILIDEIDLHLHPLWQQMVIPKLTQVFSNCQFLISTHSPNVITHIRPESLHLLELVDDRLESSTALHSYGQTVERVLEDIMGLQTTRPAEIEAELKNIFEQINGGELEKAQDLISRLEVQIGEDPELVKANVLIRRKELIGK